jgi:NAD(P)-dependent dehydrogenase (short-subunit alcohol dehydrogenase family)
MSSVSGKVAAVTGAGSGIGRALAVELAARGARLALSDIGEAGLAETAELAGQHGVEAHTKLLDVGDRDAVAAYADEVAGRYGVVHQAYNNAGIAFSRSVLDSTYEDYERVLRVNLWGVIHGTKAFLPHLIDSGDGHLVNVSSLNGYMAQGQMTHYCTSKFAVRGFTEAVRMEMLQEGHPVLVSSVHPGGIKTNIADAAMASARELGLPVTEADERRHKAYTEKLLRMDPAEAARIIVDGVEKKKARILVGQDAKFVDGVVRLLPSRYPQVAVAAERRFAR